MIDKKEFNNTFQYFDKETIIEIIDMFAEQQPEIMNILAQNIADYDLVAIKLNAHKIKGQCSQLFDRASADHAKKLEDYASAKIVDIVYIMLDELPETILRLKQENNESELLHKVIFVAHSIKNFLIGLNVSFDPENTLKLQNLEKSFLADGMPQMLVDLKISSGQLLAELLQMKKELKAK